MKVDECRDSKRTKGALSIGSERRKSILNLLLILAVLSGITIACVSLTTDGQDSSADASGKDGGIEYYYHASTKKLNIWAADSPDSGYTKGQMKDYDNGSNKAPWREQIGQGTALVIESGVLNIGNYAFYDCSKLTGSLTIPDSVTSIGQYAFYKCSGFTGSLAIPNSVTRIDHYAFYKCSKLTGSLTIHDDVTFIGNSAFELCSGFTGTLTIGNKITSIGDTTFANTGFTGSLTIPGSVTSIANYAFYGCDFSGSLTIPDSVTSIGQSAFEFCSIFNGTLTIPGSVTSIGNRAFIYCQNFTDVVFLGNKPTIGTDAFYFETDSPGKTYNVHSCWANSATFPGYERTKWNYISTPAIEGGIEWCYDKDLKLIVRPTESPEGGYNKGQMKDYDDASNRAPWCSLIASGSTLEIQSGVYHIGNFAFYECSEFTGSLTIPNSVTSIGNSAFNRCSGFTGSLVIPNNVASIGNCAFYDCSNFADVRFLGNQPTLGDSAFKLKTSSSAKTYDVYSYWANYKTFPTYDYTKWNYIATFVTDGGIEWCYDKDLKLIIRPSSTPESGYSTGQMKNYDDASNRAPWRSLIVSDSKLEIQSGVYHIGDYAFCLCTGFTGSLTIPDSVTSVGECAFYNSLNFADVRFLGNRPTIGDNAFYLNIYEPAKTYNVYSCWANSKTFAIYGNTFWVYNATFLTDGGIEWSYDKDFKLTIRPSSTPESGYSTGQMKDYNGSSAPWSGVIVSNSTLDIQSGVLNIGNYAFYNCTGFNGSLVIPSGVTSIGDYAFYNCTGFTGTLTITKGVTSIENSAFYNCTGFNELIITNTVTSIGDHAFYGCTGFTGFLVIPNSVTSIGDHAFYGCTGFNQYLIIGNKVASIGNFAFYNCPNFTYVKFLGDQPTLGNNAFELNISSPTKKYYIHSNGWANSETFPGYGYTTWEYLATLGTSGGIFWDYDTYNYILTISPADSPESGYLKGQMKNYDDGSNKAPWRSLVMTPGSTLEIQSGVFNISNYAFYGCFTTIGPSPSLTLPNSVTSIGSYAFYGCTGFTELTIPNSVTSIGNHAFYGCTGFKGSLVIPDSVISIGNHAFYGCTGFDGYLMIGKGVTTIGNHAFANCPGFNNVIFLGNKPTIEIDAFEFNTTSEKTHDVYSNGWANSETFPGYRYTHWTYIATSGTSGGIDWSYDMSAKKLTISPAASPESGYVSGKMMDYTSSSLAPWNNLILSDSTLDIQLGVLNIGNYAFYNCSNFSGSLVIPNSVTSVGDSAFEKCSGFTKVTFLGGMLTYGTNSFKLNADGEKTYSVESSGWANNRTFPEPSASTKWTYTTIFVTDGGIEWSYDSSKKLIIRPSSTPDSGFVSGEMKNFTSSTSAPWTWNNLIASGSTLDMQSGVLNIGDHAFYGCTEFTGTLTIPDSVTSIGKNAFKYCSGFTGSLAIPGNVTLIDDGAFYECSGFTGSLVIPNSVTYIGSSAFYYCSGFTGTLTIGDSVASIGENAFKYCSGFTGSLVIPNSVTSVGDNAFYGCPGFTDVKFLGGMPALGNGSFMFNATSPAKTYTVESSGWANSTTFPGYQYTQWRYVTAFVTDGGIEWSYDYSNNKLVIRPSSTQENGFAPGEMKNYTSSEPAPWTWNNLVAPGSTLEIQQGVLNIGDYAFNNCSGFTGSLIIPDSVKSMGDYAFNNCTGFTGSLIIPDNVTLIGDYAFNNCTGFTGSVVIPDNVTSIGDYAFSNCTGLAGTLTVGKSVTSMGDYAFNNCTGFTTIVFVPGTMAFGSDCFHGIVFYREDGTVIQPTDYASELPGKAFEGNGTSMERSGNALNTVTATVNNQSMGTVSASQATVVYGSSVIVDGNTVIIGDVQITATAKDGYKFDHWDISSDTVKGDVTATACFVEVNPKPASSDSTGPIIVIAMLVLLVVAILVFGIVYVTKKQ